MFANPATGESPDWDRIEAARITGAPRQLTPHLVELHTSLGTLTVSISVLGVRLRAGAQSDAHYGILATMPAELELHLETGADGETRVSAGDYSIEFASGTFAFRALHRGRQFQSSASDGHFVRRYRVPPLARSAAGWVFSLELEAQEPVYGLGEKWSAINKRGQWLRSYNHDALGVNAERSYKNTPFLWSPRGWGCFVHTPAPVTHSVGFAPWSQRAYLGVIEDPELDVFLFAGDSPADLLKHYAMLTGFTQQPPAWSLGTILSKAYYKDASELLEAAKEVRRRQMPCDTITLDGRAWQDTATRFAFEWDALRYPEPKEVIDQLKALNFRICLWEYPLVSMQNPLHAQLAERGWLLRDSRSGEAYRYQWDTSPFGEVLTPLPDSGIIDFTHPQAYAFWRDAHAPLFELGIDMIKADFGEQLDSEFMLAHNGDNGVRLHNAYALLYNRCVFEAAERYTKTRPFLFSRAAWSGSQRYPSQWGGDPQADWQGLAASLRGALSWGLSGGPYFATDIGGFYKDTRDPELYTRWAQAAVFAAHLRLHGVGSREPWSYAKEAENAVMEALQLRYRLLPYLRKVVAQAGQTGLPVQRAMVLSFPDEPQSWGFEHQFMCGDDLLVVPCLRAGGEIEFYLPAGQWHRFPDRRRYNGGRYYRETLKLDELAVFVPAGRRIPLGPARQWVEGDPDAILEDWNAV